jgi:hypothetical protein
MAPPTEQSTSGPAPTEPEVTLTPQQAIQAIQDLQGQVAALGVGTSKMKVKQPPTFKGDKRKVDEFLTKLGLYLRYNSASLPQEQDKVLCSTIYLEGEVFDWFNTYTQDYLGHDMKLSACEEETRRIFSSFEYFAKKLRATYGDVDEQRTAERKLQQLRQQGSANQYTSKFMQVTAKLNWDEDPLIAAYY